LLHKVFICYLLLQHASVLPTGHFQGAQFFIVCSLSIHLCERNSMHAYVARISVTQGDTQAAHIEKTNELPEDSQQLRPKLVETVINK